MHLQPKRPTALFFPSGKFMDRNSQYNPNQQKTKMRTTGGHPEDRTVGLSFVRSSFLPEFPGSKDVLFPFS